MLKYGRRLAIAVDSVFFILGPIIMAASWSIAGLAIGRFIVGIGIGISAVVVPAYLGEVAPAGVRGRVVELYELMLCFGMLAAALVDAALDAVPGNWHWMVGAPVLPAIIMSFSTCILPESPRWLVLHGRMDEALAVIHRVHTSQVLPTGVQNSTAEVEAELLDLWSTVEKDKDAVAQRVLELRAARAERNTKDTPLLGTEEEWAQLRPEKSNSAADASTSDCDFMVRKENNGSGAGNRDDAEMLTAASPPGSEQVLASVRSDTKGFWSTAFDMLRDIWAVAWGAEGAAFRMILVLAFFNQAFASTAIINYAPSVLEHAGVESNAAASLFTSLVSASKLVGVALSFFLVDSLGRRPLLLWGSVGSALALSALVPADWLDSHALLVMGMCLFIFSFSLSWAGVFWVLLSELFSMSAKSPAASAATAVLFATGAVADMTFLTLHGALGPISFVIYAVIAVLGGVYVAAAVPETKGKTLLEVQELLRRDGGGSSRRGVELGIYVIE